MPVSQRFIDLLNVPLPLLREAGEKEKIDGAKGMSRWQLADSLEERPRASLEGLSQGYLYAGRTSLSWYRFDEPRDPEADVAEDEDSENAPPETLSGLALDPDAVREILNEMSESGDAFSEASRPAEITRDPKLVVARERSDGTVLLTFATEKPVGRVIKDFEKTPVFADEFFNAVLDVSSGLIEVRTNQQTAHRFGQSWLSDFCDRFDGLAAFPVGISINDARALKGELAAGLHRYRGKAGDGGSIDTVEFTVSPDFEDLEGEADFETARAGSEQLIGDLAFTFDESQFTIRVSCLKGSIYFVTPAPESALEYVREALRTIKVRHHKA